MFQQAKSCVEVGRLFAPAVNCICVMNGLSNHETARFHIRNKKIRKGRGKVIKYKNHFFLDNTIFCIFIIFSFHIIT